MKRTTVQLAAVILLVGVVPAVATMAASDAGVIAEETYEGDGYAAWEITAEAGDELRLEGTAFAENSSMEAVGFWILDADLDHEYAAVLSHYYGPGNIVYVSAGPASAAPVTDGGSTGGGFLGITTFDVPADGTYHVVAMAGADGANEGRLTVLGPDSVTVAASSSGEAFLAKPPSFQGLGASVAAETTSPSYNAAQVRVLQDATYPVGVDGHLFGLFSGDTNTGELEISIDTPDGTLEGQTSYFMLGEPAGDYTLRIDENVDAWDTEGVCQMFSESFCTQPTIYALGADVQVP